MTWAHPLILALVPAALCAAWWTFRRAGDASAPRFAHITRLWADARGLSDRPAATRRRLRGVCFAAGALLALAALARPQWGEVAEESFDQSREVLLALDLSRSMLADDVAPTRLARAKMLIDALLDQLQGERVGLTVFAGTAFVQSPLSADYEVLRELLAELDPTYLPQGGTNYTAMLNAAVQAFGEHGDGDRYLVVLSDGEAHDDGWKALVPRLTERGIKVIGLGVGTPAGALVPAAGGGLVKDAQGNAVLSRLEPATLHELAAATGGTYRDAASWVDIAALVDATVAQGQKGQYIEQRSVRLQDRFQWFLAPALLLMLLSYWIDFPIYPHARALKLRGRRPHPASAPAIAAALVALAAWHTPSQANAAVSDQPPPRSGAVASQIPPLVDTVAELSAKPALAAPDYERLATETISYASQPSAPQGPARIGVIDDALAAVERGAADDPRAADWPALRQQLEALKQAKQDPPQEQPQDQPQQPQDDQQQGGEGETEQQEQNGQQGDNSQEQQQGADAPQPQSGENGAQSESQSADGKSADGKSADQPQGESGAEPSDAQNAAGAGDESNDDQSNRGGAAANDEQAKADQPAGDKGAAGEQPRRDDVQPLGARDAGLGDRDETPLPDEAAQAAPQQEPPAGAPQPGSRMVGGGRALPDGEAVGDTQLADALGKIDGVKDGDAPAVLFDRMNRAEGRPQPPDGGKNW